MNVTRAKPKSKSQGNPNPPTGTPTAYGIGFMAKAIGGSPPTTPSMKVGTSGAVADRILSGTPEFKDRAKSFSNKNPRSALMVPSNSKSTPHLQSNFMATKIMNFPSALKWWMNPAERSMVRAK